MSKVVLRLEVEVPEGADEALACLVVEEAVEAYASSLRTCEESGLSAGERGHMRWGKLRPGQVSASRSRGEGRSLVEALLKISEVYPSGPGHSGVSMVLPAGGLEIFARYGYLHVEGLGRDVVAPELVGGSVLFSLIGAGEKQRP